MTRPPPRSPRPATPFPYPQPFLATRETELCTMIADGGSIGHAVKRLKWPGEAAVVVSVVHVAKGETAAPTLDGRLVRRVSAYLVEGDLDRKRTRLNSSH